LRKVARTIILSLNIIVAFLLLLAYSAPYINPSTFLFPAFLGLAYPYILLLNLIYLVYWIVRLKKEFLISLITILLGWGHLMNFLPLNFSDKSESASINEAAIVKIMSYNVRTFDQYDWIEKDNTVDDIFKLINSESPDILCIQEFYTKNRIGYRERDIIRKLQHFPYYSIYYSIKSSPNTGFGIATFSRYPIIKTSRIPFDNSVNQAVYTDIEFNKDTLRVFNIHLQSIQFRQNNYSFIDTLSLKYSNKQIEEVKDIGKRLRNAFILRAEQSKIIHNYISESTYPVIVSGDFNDTPISYSYRRIQKGLTDAFRESGKGLGNTYAGDLPSFRIDYILYSKELESVDFKRIKSKYSDHFPILSSIQKTEISINE
jgi:endonuclease/exonuclease/phosphatase family metal-dependent hydrolase